MVPPRVRMSSTSVRPIGLVRFSIGPCHPLRNPTISQPCALMPLRTTARITAFRPGQSPPPVSTPMRICLPNLSCSVSLRLSRAVSVQQRGSHLPDRKPDFPPMFLDHLPPREVVARVGEGVVGVRGRGRQLGPADVVPALPQVAGEPGQGT